MNAAEVDRHSFANPEEVRVTHVELDLEVRFAERELRGWAALDFAPAERARTLVVDTRDLKIAKTEPGGFVLGATDPVLGTPLRIPVAAGVKRVRIEYSTSPGAQGLQWLEPPQTAGKRRPFLYSQSQSIHARSWIPIQDSPGVRVTYAARIRTPEGLRAVMSAAHEGDGRFRMPQPVPAYLIALAVGELEFRSTGKRTGVWAEPPVVERAAKEFEDTEKMVEAAEALYGQYRWDRYDVLVCPPSFPIGGMENPRLTFATPTILAGDKSLVSLVAHELAHSWSGNLVTNATWRDFWLNEGFTVYFERRIQEKVYGRERSEMEALLELNDLRAEMKELPAEDTLLYYDLTGRNPDEGATQVPYIKGYLLLRAIEEEVGRDRFDRFLRGYFDKFAFESMTTERFLQYLRGELPGLKVAVDEWVYKPGLPAVIPRIHSDVLERVAAGKKAPSNTQEWVHYLATLKSPDMAALDARHHLTESGNYEILQPWLLMAVKNGYKPAYPRLEKFLMEVGRQKYIKPLYQELAKSEKEWALRVYAKARAGYHPIAQTAIDAVLK